MTIKTNISFGSNTYVWACKSTYQTIACNQIAFMLLCSNMLCNMCAIIQQTSARLSDISFTDKNRVVGLSKVLTTI